MADPGSDLVMRFTYSEEGGEGREAVLEAPQKAVPPAQIMFEEFGETRVFTLLRVERTA